MFAVASLGEPVRAKTNAAWGDWETIWLRSSASEGDGDVTAMTKQDLVLKSIVEVVKLLETMSKPSNRYVDDRVR